MSNGAGINGGSGISAAWQEMLAMGINPGGLASGANGGTGAAGPSGGSAGGGFSTGGGSDPFSGTSSGPMADYMLSMGLDPSQTGGLGAYLGQNGLTGGDTGASTFSPTGAGGTSFDPATGVAAGEINLGNIGQGGNGPTGLGNFNNLLGQYGITAPVLPGMQGGLGKQKGSKGKGKVPTPQPAQPPPSPTQNPIPVLPIPGTPTPTDPTDPNTPPPPSKPVKKQKQPQITPQQIKSLLQMLQQYTQQQSGGITPQKIPAGGTKGKSYPVNPNYPPAPVGNNQLYDPNALKAYDASNTPGSGFTSPLAGMGLLNPQTGGTIGTPTGGMPSYLSPSPTFNLTYGQGAQQLQGNQPPQLSGGAMQQNYGVSNGPGPNPAPQPIPPIGQPGSPYGPLTPTPPALNGLSPTVSPVGGGARGSAGQGSPQIMQLLKMLGLG